MVYDGFVNVIGAGLAGCEAAYKLASNGIKVRLFEMKPNEYTKAHHYQGFAELVCSNSLKASRIDSAAGLLKEEMRMLNSLCLKAADSCSVAAGGALAVDRERFSDYITNKIKENSNIEIVTGEVTEIPEGYCIVASGPLTSDALAQKIKELVKSDGLSFFDAAAPIVTASSVDKSIVFAASRYGKGDDDYLNCPMNKEEYEIFYGALVNAEQAPINEFDKRDFSVYEGCMPIEIMAKRGADTMRFGPLKPVGLRDPRTDHRPWAVVQLRQENSAGTLYNLVGFQTNLKFAEQKRVFSMIPGLKDAEFMRYGVMHRNTFLDSPRLLNSDFSLKSNPQIFFAGQITGVEGYMESAGSGIVAAIQLLRRLKGEEAISFSQYTMLGSLAYYISDSTVEKFQPMGSNMGILPPLENKVRDKKQRYGELANRSIEALTLHIKEFSL